MEIELKPSPRNPSAADVIDAFSRAFDDYKNPHRLTFSIRGGEMALQITSLSYESGSPGMLIIEGNALINNKNVHFRGFYNVTLSRAPIKIPIT